jgi:uncharacterized protein (DUF1778 family)
MARPSKDENERRTYHLGVRLNPAERRQLERAAQAAGLGTGDYVRRQALGHAHFIHAPRSLAPAPFRQLRGFGAALNQIARTANGTHRLPDTLAGIAKRVEGFLDDQIGYGEGLDAAIVDQLRRLAVNAAQLARVAQEQQIAVPAALASLRKRLDRILNEARAQGAAQGAAGESAHDS